MYIVSHTEHFNRWYDWMVTWSNTDKNGLEMCNIGHENSVDDCDETDLGDMLYSGLKEWNWYYYYYYYYY